MEELDRDMTAEEIREAIKKLKCNKAAGIYGIPNEFIKYGEEEFTSQLLREIFNKILSNERWPEEWETGLIITVYKKGDIIIIRYSARRQVSVTHAVFSTSFCLLLLSLSSYNFLSLCRPLSAVKKGDKKDPKNYRGITLLPTISKVFTKILSNRIQKWAEEKK